MSSKPGLSQTGILVGGAVALAAVAAGGYALFGSGSKSARKKIAKYGEWRSPITTELIVAKSKSLSWLQVWKNFLKFHKYENFGLFGKKSIFLDLIGERKFLNSLVFFLQKILEIALVFSCDLFWEDRFRHFLLILTWKSTMAWTYDRTLITANSSVTQESMTALLPRILVWLFFAL